MVPNVGENLLIWHLRESICLYSLHQRAKSHIFYTHLAPSWITEVRLEYILVIPLRRVVWVVTQS